METFYISIMAITGICTVIRSHQSVHLKGVHFVICKLSVAETCEIRKGRFWVYFYVEVVGFWEAVNAKREGQWRWEGEMSAERRLLMRHYWWGRRGAVQSMGGCMSLGWKGGTFSPRAYGGERWCVVIFE